MADAIRWSELTATPWAIRRTRKQARKRMPSELLPSSFLPDATQAQAGPKDATHARERTLQGLVADSLQSSPPKEAEWALKRALMRRPSELCHGSHCKGDQPAPQSRASRQAGEPYRGRVYDPCCGSSGMFVQSEEFIRAHRGRIGDISIYGQELNYTTWRLAKMNLAIRGIDGKIEQGDSFTNDRFPDLKADYILANPPFNMKRWGAVPAGRQGEQLRPACRSLGAGREDRRWKFGVPPTGNANFAWVQHAGR